MPSNQGYSNRFRCPPGDPDDDGAVTAEMMLAQSQTPMMFRDLRTALMMIVCDPRSDVPAALNDDDAQQLQKRCYSSPERSMVMRQFHKKFSPPPRNPKILYCGPVPKKHFGDPTLMLRRLRQTHTLFQRFRAAYLGRPHGGATRAADGFLVGPSKNRCILFFFNLEWKDLFGVTIKRKLDHPRKFGVIGAGLALTTDRCRACERRTPCRKHSASLCVVVLSTAHNFCPAAPPDPTSFCPAGLFLRKFMSKMSRC